MAGDEVRNVGASSAARRTWVASAAIVSTVVAVSVIAVLATGRGQSVTLLSCRVLSNGVVPWLAARSSQCSLEPYDRVFALERSGRRIFMSDLRQLRDHVAEAEHRAHLWVRRRGLEQLVDVPIVTRTPGEALIRLGAGLLVSVLLLGTALVILWNARTGARWPLLILYGSLSVLLIVTLADRDATSLNMAGTIALGLTAPALAHLAMMFPRERSIAISLPIVLKIPYAVAGVLIVVSLLSISRAPVVWATSDRLLIMLAIAGAAFVIAGSVFALREAQSQVEQARARILLYGMVGVVGVPLLVSLGYRGSVPGGSATVLGLAAVLFPLPVGYAISRYQLFDATLHMQRVVARLMVPTVLALLATSIVFALSGLDILYRPLGEPAAVFSIVYGLLLSCELIRAPLWSAADAWASRPLEVLRKLRDEHAGAIGELLPAGDYGRILGSNLERALKCREILVYVATTSGWTLVYGSSCEKVRVSGSPTVEASFSPWTELLHLALEERANTPLEWARYEVAVPLRIGSELVGGVLIGASADGRPYTTIHLSFIRSVCTATAVSVHNAHLAQDLATAERFAAVGKLGAELAHELGKPLGLLERIASRLPSRLHDPARARRDASMIFDLARELRTTTRSVLGEREGRSLAQQGSGGWLRVDELVERAVRRISGERGEMHVLIRLEPNLPEVPDGNGRLVRALANCLENARLASQSCQAVEVIASSMDRGVEIVVMDRGDGMSREARDRAFEPFFSTRPNGQGAGLGLSFAREAIEAIGGRIQVETELGRGTQVIIHLPKRFVGAST